MASTPRPIDRFAILGTLALCACWGLNQVAGKVALPDIGPVTQATLRAAIGSIVLLMIVRAQRRDIFHADGTLIPGIVAGLLFAFEFIALFLALKATTASSAAVFFYTAPFFVAVGAAAFLPAERLEARQWVGLALAFLGVVAGLYRAAPGATLGGDLLALVGGGMWGATTVVVKATKLKIIDPVKALLYQTVASALVSGAWVYAAGEPLPTHLSALSIVSLVYQSVLVVGISYAFWFYLLQTYRAGELAAFTFVTPIVGVFSGAVLLGEPLTVNFLVALALVVAGLIVVSWPAEKVMFRFAARGVRQ